MSARSFFYSEYVMRLIVAVAIWTRRKVFGGFLCVATREGHNTAYPGHDAKFSEDFSASRHEKGTTPHIQDTTQSFRWISLRRGQTVELSGFY